jgi:hypothetical protein
MGFVLCVLYLAIYYLTPAYLFGSLAESHVQVIIAALAVLFSLPALIRSFLFKSPQTLALLGLAVAVFLSYAVGRHWIGGGRVAVFNFLPNCMAFFLICLHVTSKRRVQMIVVMLLAVCLIDIGHGVYDLRNGVEFSGPGPTADPMNGIAQGATASPYLLKQDTESGETNYRIQGLGTINDPNDFGQLIVCVIPLVFIFWRKGKMATNAPLVLLPVAILLVGVFLTHSRGALVALTVMSLFAARRRIGTLPAALMAGGMFAAAMALQFTGGRNISATAGEDRTNLWGEGLRILRAHPFFGVGFGDVWEHTEGALTAHNSVIVCAAELGLVGLFFWSLYLFPTFRDALAIGSPNKVNEGEPAVIEAAPYPHSALAAEEIAKADINGMGRALSLSLIGFLAAGWFLSRAFVATLFLLGGMIESVYEMAAIRGMIGPRLKLKRVIPYSAMLAFSLLVLMYIMIRILNLMH